MFRTNSVTYAETDFAHQCNQPNAYHILSHDDAELHFQVTLQH